MDTKKTDFSEKNNRTSERKTANRLSDRLGKTFIIAYKEDTEELESTLKKEGLDVRVMRQQHQPEYKEYSPSYLCLLNHKSVWEIAKQEAKPTLIVEADFVPVIGLGKLPVPFNINVKNVGISWIYLCAPQIYTVDDDGYAEGFSTSMVAYILSPKAAEYLIELAEETSKNPGPTAYSSWDSEVEKFLRERKLKNYVCFRNYGEHGGKPNLEHHQRGLSKFHRADVLYGKLAFMPLYVDKEKNPYFQLLSARLYARIKGIGRLLLGKFLRVYVLKGSSYKARLLSFAIRRHLTLRL